jgi:ABC-2 type transport system permease protein
MSTSTYQSPGTAQATWLVAEREIRMRLRSKAFLISTGITLLIVLASVVIGGIVGANPPKDKLLAVGSAVAVAESFQAFDVIEVGSAEEAKEQVLAGEAESAVVPSAGPTGVTIIALDRAPSMVLSLFSVSPEVEILDPDAQNDFLIYIVALGFGLVFFMSAITFGSIIAQSVVEEKQTRIVEILMASVPVRVLLAGKILGNSILAFGQIVVIAGLAGIGMLATGQDILLADIGPSLVWFAILFAFGFVLLAAMFAAASALVSRV